VGWAGRVAYRPVGWVAGAAAGLLAGALFNQLWRVASGDDRAPSATDKDRGWSEILLAAGLQGAIFGLVKAAVDRGGALAVSRTTGYWPN